jgi:hypothetical protein
MPVVTEKYLVGAQTTLLSTGLNTLLSGSTAISAAYDNTAGNGVGDGYTECDLELLVTFASSATTGAISIWFLITQDGANYEDGSAGVSGSNVTPARAPDAVIPVNTGTAAQRIIRRTILPAGLFKVLLKNDGTGVAFASTGNTFKLRPITRQGV